MRGILANQNGEIFSMNNIYNTLYSLLKEETKIPLSQTFFSFLTYQIQTSVLQTHTAVTSMPCVLTPQDRTVVLAQQVIQGMVGHVSSQV